MERLCDEKVCMTHLRHWKKSPEWLKHGKKEMGWKERGWERKIQGFAEHMKNLDFIFRAIGGHKKIVNGGGKG